MDHTGFLPQMTAYNKIVTNESIRNVLLYMDFNAPISLFTNLTADAQCDKFVELAALQETNDVTFVWPILQHWWEPHLNYTTAGGSYGGASVYDVILGLLDPVEAPDFSSISNGANSISIQWPNRIPGFKLYAATALVDSVTWTLVTNETQVVGDENELILPADKPQRYFQLRSGE